MKQGTNITRTDYLSGYQYKDGKLQFFGHAEGYVNVSSLEGMQEYKKFAYVYNYTDHLGNIRLSYTQNPKNENQLIILEENNYYPFGLKHDSYNKEVKEVKLEELIGLTSEVNVYLEPDLIIQPVLYGDYKYQYNGKEFQDELGLNWNDYGARNYDAAIGRWMNMDPLAELSRRYSLYAYALNNPVFFIDPDGMLATIGPDIIRDKDGNIVYETDGATMEVKHPGGSKAVVEFGYIFADDGTPIQVIKNNQGGDKGWDTNCHGTTFADGEFTIHDNQADEILVGDDYQQVSNIEDASVGDVAIYLDSSGKIIHSATVISTDGTIDGTVVEGLGGLETQVHQDKLEEGFSGASSAAIAHKESEDRIASDEEIIELRATVYPIGPRKADGSF